MKILKNYFKYFVVFLFFLIVLIFFGYNNTDIIWNYGFSHAIRMGEIPYRDFNLISTPLYAFIMSIGLFVYDSYFVFLIEQSLLCTLLLFFFQKMFSKNYLIILFVFCFPIFYTIFPNYNFLVLFHLILLIYLDNNEKNDYLIGVFLGLLILSKHTVGGIIFVCSLISCFDFHKILFVLYLIITKSFHAFLNLSFWGLFDFGQSNNFSSKIYLLIAGIILCHMLLFFKRDFKNKNNYYLLGSFSFVLPICDYFHLNYLIAVYVVILLFYYDNKIPNFQKISFVFIILICIFNVVINYPVYKDLKFSSLDHFEGYITTKKHDNYMNDIALGYSKSKKNYMFSFTNMFFDIATNHQITYFDVPLYGNFGYDGTNSMKRKIDKMHGVYFYINDNDNIQYAKDIYNYVKKTGVYVKSYNGLDIYYKK